MNLHEMLETRPAKTASLIFWVVINILWAILPVYVFYLLLFAPDDALALKVDAIDAASQIGRLDLVSLALTFTGIGVGFFALFSFFQLKQDSADAVEKAASAIEANLDNRVHRLCEDEFKRRELATRAPSGDEFPTDRATEISSDV